MLNPETNEIIIIENNINSKHSTKTKMPNNNQKNKDNQNQTLLTNFIKD